MGLYQAKCCRGTKWNLFLVFRFSDRLKWVILFRRFNPNVLADRIYIFSTIYQKRCQRRSGGSCRSPLCMIWHDEILFWTLEPRCTRDLRNVHWIPIVLLTLVTYNIKLYLPPILIQSPCLFIYTPGHVYNSAVTLWCPSRLHDGLDWSVGDS